MTPTTRKSGMIAVLAASLMTSSTQFSSVKCEIPGVFTPKTPLTLEIPRGINLTPLDFFKFFSKPPEISRKKKILEASICDLLVVEWMLRVNRTQSYGENTKSPIQDFHRFGYKKILKFIFFKIIPHIYLLFSHTIVWFYNIFKILNWNSEKKSWKFFENLSLCQNFQFLGLTTLHISCHNLAELWPRTKIFSPKYPSKILLKVSRRHTYKNPSRFGRYWRRY